MHYTRGASVSAYSRPLIKALLNILSIVKVERLKQLGAITIAVNTQCDRYYESTSETHVENGYSNFL